jgi:5-methyltetrahydrofolate--homocysteine methyltransferase
MSEFLDALNERVLIFDGAFGTWVQAHDLGPDDFGGPALEVATRPRAPRPGLIRRCTAEC